MLKDIETFCLQTLQALLKLEKTRQTEPLSLEHLVRMDIGVFKGKDDTLNYYVNEVSRPPCCSLMQLLEVDTNRLEEMAGSVRMGLVQMYDHHCAKFPAHSRNHRQMNPEAY